MRTVIVICTITASVFIGTPVWASPCVLDQFQESQNYLYGVGGPTLMAQTFTAGLDGVLCHIEIGNTTDSSWYGVSPPVIQIRDTQGGQPGSTVLGSVTLSGPVPYNNWTLPINFLDQGIDVTSGQMYSIVLWASTSTSSVSVGATNYDSYGAGDLWAWGQWVEGEEETWRRLMDVDPTKDVRVYDMQFRTYVQAIPLPAGLWLGICAVSVAGWHLKRQRR